MTHVIDSTTAIVSTYLLVRQTPQLVRNHLAEWEKRDSLDASDLRTLSLGTPLPVWGCVNHSIMGRLVILFLVIVIE